VVPCHGNIGIPPHGDVPHYANVENESCNTFTSMDINIAPKKDILQNIQELLNSDMPSLDHNILNTHVEFCKVSIVFLSFVYWYRMAFDTSVRLGADDFRKRMQSMSKMSGEHDGWKETLHEFLNGLTFGKFYNNTPNDIKKLVKITQSYTKWTSTVTEKVKLPTWSTELEYKSYKGPRKGLYVKHKDFLQSIGFKF